MTKKNSRGQAFSASSYQAFIEQVVDKYGGFIDEEDLDDEIEQAYGEFWGETDQKKWGDQKHSKWKQNVASAKAGLDRRGIIVRYDQVEDVPVSAPKPGWKVTQHNGKWLRKIKRTYRVRLPESIYLRAYIQWRSRRPPKKKRSYEPLRQPNSVHFVPE